MKTYSIKEYKKIFDNLYPQLCVFAYKHIKGLDISEDIVQEVFIKVWKDKIVFNDEKHIVNYFYKSVKYRCLDYFRTKEYKFLGSYDDPITFENMLIDYSEDNILENITPSCEPLHVLVENALQTLSTQVERVMRLSLENHTNVKIADLMSISVNTVKLYKKTAYCKLREILEPIAYDDNKRRI